MSEKKKTENQKNYKEAKKLLSIMHKEAIKKVKGAL